MSKLRRYYAPNQCVFITSVTANRAPLLVRNAAILKHSAANTLAKSDFTIVAWVIMPDHFHVIIENPGSDTARIIQQVKLAFSVSYRRTTGFVGAVWQPRYLWPHSSFHEYRRVGYYDPDWGIGTVAGIEGIAGE